MPPRDWQVRVTDILGAIAAIQEFTAGMDYASFVRDQKTVDAVLLDISVIGEAAGYVPENVVSAHSEIPWRDMREMRNVVVHAYFRIDNEILWDTVQFNLPAIRPPLKRLLQ